MFRSVRCIRVMPHPEGRRRERRETQRETEILRRRVSFPGIIVRLYIVHMDIALLTFDGCPNAEPARRLLEQTLMELGLKATIHTVVISDVEQAERHHFLGSPTIQINSRDIEVQRRCDPASFSCRVYKTLLGTSGIPPKDMLAQAISKARHGGH